MSNTVANAVAAYATAAKRPVAEGAPAAATDAAGTGGFAAMVKDAAQQALDAGKGAEQMSKEALSGKADLRDVVLAVNNAELTLETVVAIRDKVISAYTDILRMPI